MIVGTQAEGAFSITLALGPRWPNVELARSMVCSCVTAAFGQSEYGDLVATVTSELLENAIKYGDWGLASSAVQLTVASSAEGVTVDVACPSEADSPDLRELRAVLDWIRSFPTPREAYEAHIFQVARGPILGGESRMGLVRTAGEAGCALDLVTDATDGLLHVRATAQRPA